MSEFRHSPTRIRQRPPNHHRVYARQLLKRQGAVKRRVFDNVDRKIIRLRLSSYMKLYGIGAPKLRDRIVDAIGNEHDDLVQLKTLQRFLADSNRTDDPFVGRCQDFLDIVAPQPPVDGIGAAFQKFFIHEDAARHGRKFDLCGHYARYERYFDVSLHQQIFEKFCVSWEGKPGIEPSDYDLFTLPEFKKDEGVLLHMTPIPGSVCIGVRAHEFSGEINDESVLQLATEHQDSGDTPYSFIQRNGILVPLNDWESLMIVAGIIGVEIFRLCLVKSDPIVLQGIEVPGAQPYHADEDGEERITWTPPTEIRLEKVAE